MPFIHTSIPSLNNSYQSKHYSLKILKCRSDDLRSGMQHNVLRNFFVCLNPNNDIIKFDVELYRHPSITNSQKN